MTEIVLDTLQIEVPVATHTEGYVSGHVEVQLRSKDQKVALKLALIGLRESGARLANGLPVVNGGDVVRWLLERVAGLEEAVPVVRYLGEEGSTTKGTRLRCASPGQAKDGGEIGPGQAKDGGEIGPVMELVSAEPFDSRQYVQDWMAQEGLSITALAKKAGVQRGHLKKALDGETSFVGEVGRAVCKVMGIDLDSMVVKYGEEEPLRGSIPLRRTGPGTENTEGEDGGDGFPVQ